MPRAITVMTAALLLLCPLISVVGLMDAAFNPVPVLTLSITPTELQAVVTPSQNGPVMFGGNATVEMLPFMTVTVTLSASCQWPAILSPSTMTFEDSITQQFYVTVVVPPRTSSLMVGTLIVSGTAKAPGISIVTASANAVVTVRQYFGLVVSVLGGPFEGLHAGSTVTGRLAVNNTGNGLDSVTIDLLDPHGLISTRDMIRSVDIKQEESEEVLFTLHVNGSLGPMANISREIAFVCTSTEARNMGLDFTQTAWCTLSFGTTPASPSEGVPSGGGGDDGGTRLTDAPGGIPLAVVVLVVLIVALSVISYLGRERGRPDEVPDDPTEDAPSIGRKA
jgi:hypothetical protein